MRKFLIFLWVVFLCSLIWLLAQKAFSSERVPVRIFHDFKSDYDYDIRAVEAVRMVSKEQVDFMACNVLLANVPVCSTSDSRFIYTIIFTYDGSAIVVSNRLD